MASSTSTCSSDTLCAAVSREPCALLVAQRALAPPPPARAPRPTARRPRTSASCCAPCTRCRACVCLCCVVSGCGWLGLGWVGLVRVLNVMVGARAQRGGVLNVVAFSTWWQRRVPRGSLPLSSTTSRCACKHGCVSRASSQHRHAQRDRTAAAQGLSTGMADQSGLATGILCRFPTSLARWAAGR